MASGVYKIINLRNKRSYIGSATNTEGRWQKHLNLLNKKKHHSYKLQEDWIKYGEKSFDFVVIHKWSPTPTSHLENSWALRNNIKGAEPGNVLPRQRFLSWFEKFEYLVNEDNYNIDYPEREDDDTFQLVLEFLNEEKSEHAQRDLFYENEVRTPPEETTNSFWNFFFKKKFLDRQKQAELEFFRALNLRSIHYLDPRIKIDNPEYPDIEIPLIIDKESERRRILDSTHSSIYNAFIYNQVAHRLFNEIRKYSIPENEAAKIARTYCTGLIFFNVGIDDIDVVTSISLNKNPSLQIKHRTS